MPAIQPERLKQQAARLCEHFGNPEAFVRGLHDLLDFYADRAHRTGQAGRPAPLISAYNVRPPVLRTLLQEVQIQAQQHPTQALALCDALWAEPYLEFRQLAAMILGRVPANPPDPILHRLQSWLTTGLELHLTEILLTKGIERLHREQPEVLIQLIQNWIEHPEAFSQQIALRALLPLIDNPSFENLPMFFRIIQPLCLITPGGLRSDLHNVVLALVERSPAETAYFLRQCLAHPDAPDTPWLVRKSLPAFPPDLQLGLRAILRDPDRRPSRMQSRKG